MPRVDFGFEGEPHLLTEIGPTLAVRIGFDPGFNPDENRYGLPELPQAPLPALVDTGALESCIDSALARELDLPVVDRGTVAGVHGASEVDYHLAQVYVPGLDWTVYGTFAGVHLTAGGQVHTALIGRTFLQDFTLTYEGRTGRVSIANE